MNEAIERTLDWNDCIEKDGSEYILLPAGDYDFTVVSFERGRHPGSEKLPACNKAILKLKVESGTESTIITHNLFLHTITEGMLSAFFTGIGQKKKGEKISMNWTQVTGATGRAEVGIHSYTKDGEEKKYNDIKKFYPKEPKQYEIGKF